MTKAPLARLGAGLIAATSAMAALPAAAQGFLGDLPVIGAPQDGGTGFQQPVTSLARDIVWLDTFLLVIITVISLFVTALLAWVVLRYNKKANPDAATFTHNSPLEVTWTVVPILILVAIGAFSLPVLFDQQRIPEGDVVVKVTGYQWYWGYEYPEEGIDEFTSYMIGSAGSSTIGLLTDDEQDNLEFIDNAMSPSTALQLERAGYDESMFRLATDTAVVVPVGKTVVMQVTGGDVIHSWTIPSFGVKQDGIPGRLAQLWFVAEEEGVYFGQCSELCGIAHAYMPITVKAVSEEKYAEWVEAMKAGELVTW